MKLIIILLTTAILQVSAAGYAQKVTLIQNNARLSTVLDEIRKQTGYDFVYSDKVMDNAKRISLNLKNAELDEALEICFKDQPLSFKVEDKMVIIRPKEKSYLEGLVDRFLAVDVRGKVVDSLGNGIAGATVSVKTGKGSTSTSANGDFYLKNVEEGSVLVISFLGYLTKEQAANKEFNYVILKQSTSQLDEVLVQAYGTTTRRLSTGNIAMVTSKEISQQNINNPLLALQGRVAGVEVTPTNGLPGGPVTIRIRGEYSTGLGGGNEGNEPLIVIDGVPQANNIAGLSSIAGGGNATTAGQMSSFSFINPNEIESISILKDADATSIYGSRGSKGVILIITKKGKAGETTIDVTVNNGWQNVTKKLNLLNTEQYLEIRKEGLKNDKLLSFLNRPEIWSGTFPDLLVWDQHRYTDWQKVLIGNTAKYTDVQGTVSGGAQTMQYRLGGNFHRETYVFPGDSHDQKGSVNMSVTGASPNQKFRATITALYMFNDNLAPPEDLTTSAMTLEPNAPDPYSANGGLNWSADPYSQEGIGTFPNNPMITLKRPFTQEINSLFSSATLNYEIFRGLEAKAAIGYSKLNGNSFRINSSLATNDPAYVPFSDPSTLRSATFMGTGTESWSVEPQLTYGTTIGKNNMILLLGASLQNQKAETDMIRAKGFNNDALMQSLGHATRYENIENNSSQYKYNGIFARLNYNWEDRYLTNLSIRRDGSSRFGPSRQFGNFWSIGTAWVFTKEKFMQSLSPTLSHGKMRFSYGTSGNDGIGDYRFFELYSPVTSIITYRGGKLLSSSGLSNPNFGWETVKKMEVGLDLGFAHDRLDLSMAYFRNRSSDLLTFYHLPAMAGPRNNLTVNQPALIQTKGWEFLINSKNFSKPNFSWRTSLNFGFMRNKRLADDDGDRTKPGLGEPFYGFASVAIFQGVDPITGQYQFLRKDGGSTFLPTEAAKTQIRTQPLFSGGLNNSFSCGNLSIDFFLQFIKQNGRNYIYQFNEMPGVYGNQPVEVLERWRSVGDKSKFQQITLFGIANPVSDITLNDAFKEIKNSSVGWVDASFIRLKTISLSYNIPDFAKQKLKLKNLRVFAQGQNFFTWTKYRGTDPETQNPYTLPPLRTITAGIQITL